MTSDASKSGVAQEAAQNIIRTGKVMTETEARQILGVTENSTWDEILQKYDNLFERNAKNGSFYLQSKIQRAKECLEAVHQTKEQGTKLHLPLPFRASKNKIQIVKHRHHGDITQEHQHRPKNPHHQRKRAVEQAVPGGVQRAAYHGGEAGGEEDGGGGH
nr:mitochondrial import inner membrane translocase subunit PAM16 like 2-like [Ipomoea trifida]